MQEFGRELDDGQEEQNDDDAGAPAVHDIAPACKPAAAPRQLFRHVSSASSAADTVAYEDRRAIHANARLCQPARSLHVERTVPSAATGQHR